MTSPTDQPADAIAEQLRLPQFPRAASYDPGWILDNVMGPNALWLAESLSEVLPLSPGMRVLVADSVPDGWKLWLRWSETCLQAKAAPSPEGLEAAAREGEMLRVDNGRALGFTRLVGRKR